MGEVRTLQQLLKEMGAPSLIADAIEHLANAMITTGHDKIDEDPDDTLFGAFEAIQRMMDLCGTFRDVVLALGIHNECAKEIAGHYEHPAAASVAQIGRQMQHALFDLQNMLSFTTPVDLLDRIKDAHAPKKEKVRGEAEAKDEDGATDPASPEDSKQEGEAGDPS